MTLLRRAPRVFKGLWSAVSQGLLVGILLASTLILVELIRSSLLNKDFRITEAGVDVLFVFLIASIAWTLQGHWNKNRKEHEKRVENLLKGILNKRKCGCCLANQDVHDTVASDSNNQQRTETMMDQGMGYRKPGRTTDQDSSWRLLVYVGLGVVVLIFGVIWVSLQLSGDEATWRPILYAWAGIAVALCFQAAYLEWINSRQEKQRQEHHGEIVCLLKELSGKLGSGEAGEE